MFANSVDFEKMCVQLISTTRGLMMAKALKDPENFVPGLSQDKEALTKQASRYSMGQILYSLTVLQDTFPAWERPPKPALSWRWRSSV